MSVHLYKLLAFMHSDLPNMQSLTTSFAQCLLFCTSDHVSQVQAHNRLAYLMQSTAPIKDALHVPATLPACKMLYTVPTCMLHTQQLATHQVTYILCACPTG